MNAECSELQALSQEELLTRTRKLSEDERRISLSILHHFAEIDRRRSFAKLGYGSLWDYVIKVLKYPESAAYRRISAMRALTCHPELEEKIRAGALSMTAVSQVQSFLKAERDQANKTYTESQKKAIFQQCENKSSRDVTRTLLTYSPLACRVQKERVITENRTVVSFVADTGLLDKIHRVRDLSAARLRNPASYPELVDLMSEVTLDEIDPTRRTVTQANRGGRNGTIQTKSVSPAARARIWREYGGRCAYIDPETGKRCDSTFGLEIEHCRPQAMGGGSNPENLRLLCKHHNQWQAIQTYGLTKMEPYLKPRKGE